ITVSKDSADRYFVSIQGEKDLKLKPVNKNKIGIDLGLTHFLIDSNGNKINNPRNTRKYAQKLKIEQRKLSKKEKGSNNYEKQKTVWYKISFNKINRWYTNYKTCSSYGHLNTKMHIKVRKFSYENCGVTHDRDINAAKNILTVGHTELACGVNNKSKALKSNAQDCETRIPLL